jgi:hypothetical protein
MLCDGIIPDVFTGSQECAAVGDPHFGEAFLPDWRSKTKFPPRPERESALNKLHCPLNG